MRKSARITLTLTLMVAAQIMVGVPLGAQQQTAAGVERDKHGKIKRSTKAKDDFKKETGYPHGRPGYVIDHVIPLSIGGRDAPSNMQWQTKADAQAKDRTERGGFGKTARVHSGYSSSYRGYRAGS
jgi:hypothetical protein